MNWIIDGKYIEAYKIWLKFNGNTEGIIDLESTIVNDHRAILRSLQDESQFKRFKVDADTIVWYNGLDLAPEFLYELTLKKAS